MIFKLEMEQIQGSMGCYNTPLSHQRSMGSVSQMQAGGVPVSTGMIGGDVAGRGRSPQAP